METDKTIDFNTWNEASTEQRSIWLREGYLLDPVSTEKLNEQIRVWQTLK